MPRAGRRQRLEVQVHPIEGQGAALSPIVILTDFPRVILSGKPGAVRSTKSLGGPQPPTRADAGASMRDQRRRRGKTNCRHGCAPDWRARISASAHSRRKVRQLGFVKREVSGIQQSSPAAVLAMVEEGGAAAPKGAPVSPRSMSPARRIASKPAASISVGHSSAGRVPRSRENRRPAACMPARSAFRSA